MVKILIIEDDFAFRRLMSATLTAHGHLVVEATDGCTGINILETQRPDLIITDIMLPEQDGIEVMMKLRTMQNAPPAIAITDLHGQAELYLRVARSLGAQRILLKPFSMESLMTAVEEVLRMPNGS
jgi:DNA-binding response OmpR family regulator